MRPHGPQRDSAARHGAAFSLIELLIALVIVGIMVMTVGPSLQQALGDNRQSRAAGDLMQIGRQAQALALDTGAAHMLWFREGGPGTSNLGHVGLYAGMNNKCQQTDWDQAIAMPDQPIAVFDMTVYNPTNGSAQPTASDGGRQVITLRARTIDANNNATERTLLRLCYQPNGDVYTSISDDTDDDVLVMQRDRAQFTIARSIGGVGYGRARQVLFPTAGSMRFQ